MANKVKITDNQGTQVFPVTHVSAVVDDNGNSVEQILGAQSDILAEAQKPFYPLLYASGTGQFGHEASTFYKKSGKKAHFTDVVPLIIVAGQSNADGRISYTSAPSWLSSANYAIPNYMVWDTATQTFQEYNVKGMSGNGGAIAGTDGTGENKYAFDAIFAHEYLNQFGGKLYMVRQTLGGIGIEYQPTTGSRNWTWQPDTDNIVSGCNSMCLALLNKLTAALAYARQQGIKLMPIAILWHQGENDSTAERIVKFKQNMSNLVMWMRGLFLSPTLPFINAYVNNDYNQYYAQANTIFAELNALDDYMKTVDMAGHYTTLSGEAYHFDASAIQYMGEQMFVEYKKMI